MNYLSQGAGYGRSGCCSYGALQRYTSFGFNSAYNSGSFYSSNTNFHYNSGQKFYSPKPAMSMNSDSSSFSPEIFLNPLRRSTQVICDAGEIKELIMPAFEKTTGEDFPEDIAISVLSEQDISQSAALYGFAWNPSIRGFAINKEQGKKHRIYAVSDELDKLMLVLGHEIGHVLSDSLKDKRDEEAKAYAFSLAWMKTIREHNIGGLKNSFMADPPAQNGIHDIALDFVLDKIRKGTKAIALFFDLCFGRVSVVAD